MDVLLVMFKSDGARRDFPLTKNRVVVGRKTNCDLRIPLPSVSRHHCELQIDHDEEQITLRDLGSSNGTYHNNVRVQEAVIEAGDEVMVGPVVFTVVVDGEPRQIKPVRTVLSASERSGGMAENEEDDITAPTPLGIDDEPEQALQAVGDDDDNIPTLDLDDDDPIGALKHIADMDDDPDGSSGFFPTGDDDEDSEPPR